MHVPKRLVEGNIVKHFKRELLPDKDNTTEYLYQIICFSTDTETKGKLVTYVALYTNDTINIGQLFTRPYDMFMSEVDREAHDGAYKDIKAKYRFELADEEEINLLKRDCPNLVKWVNEAADILKEEE